MLFLHTHFYTFGHNINSLDVHQQHQKIHFLTNNIRLKQILASDGVNAPLHIPDITDILSLKKILQLQHLKRHTHLHMITFIGLC